MSAPLNPLWWRWLLAVAAGSMLFGLGFIVLPDVMQAFFNTLFWGAPDPRFDVEATHYLKFSYGVLGAVMVGWMAGLLLVVWNGFRRGERAAWDMLVLSTSVWFVVDTAFSLAMGFPQNAVFNVLFYVLFAIPLAATYRTFHPAHEVTPARTR